MSRSRRYWRRHWKHTCSMQNLQLFLISAFLPAFIGPHWAYEMNLIWQTLKERHWRQDIDGKTLMARHWWQDFEGKTLKGRHWRQDIEDKTSKARHWWQDIEGKTLKARHWWQDIDGKTLMARHWRQDIEDTLVQCRIYFSIFLISDFLPVFILPHWAYTGMHLIRLCYYCFKLNLFRYKVHRKGLMWRH